MERMFRPGPERMPELEPSPWRTVYAHGDTTPAAAVAFEYRPLPDWNAGPYRQDVPVHGR